MEQNIKSLFKILFENVLVIYNNTSFMKLPGILQFLY